MLFSFLIPPQTQGFESLRHLDFSDFSPFIKHKKLDLYEFKTCAFDIVDTAHRMELVCKRIENIAGKGKKIWLQVLFEALRLLIF